MRLGLRADAASKVLQVAASAALVVLALWLDGWAGLALAALALLLALAPLLAVFPLRRGR